MKTWILCGLFLTSAGVAAAAPPTPNQIVQDTVRGKILQLAADNAWTGIWNQTITLVDCETGFELFQTTNSDTICPADTFEAGDFGGEGEDCSGTANDTQITFQCTTSFEIFEGCVTHIAFTYTATRNGNSYTGTLIANTTYEGVECGDLEPSCSKTVIVGTKTGPAPASACITATEPTNWGGIKSRYR